MSDGTGSVVSGSSSRGGVDYDAVEITSETPDSYHWTERRAELAQIARERGSIRRINQSELANRYGVSQQQISKDVDALAEYYRETLGDRRVFETHTLLTHVIEDLLDEDEWRAKETAARLALEQDERIREETDLQELRERLDRLEREREI